jgi:hypothetical protein
MQRSSLAAIDTSGRQPERLFLPRKIRPSDGGRDRAADQSADTCPFCVSFLVSFFARRTFDQGSVRVREIFRKKTALRSRRKFLEQTLK